MRKLQLTRNQLLSFALLASTWTSCLFGQSFPSPHDSGMEETPAHVRPVSFGFRVSGFLPDVLKKGTTEHSTTQPVVSWTFTTTSQSPNLGLGPVVEFRLGRRIAAGAELLFHRLRYEQVTEIYVGVDNPNTSADERYKTTLKQRTKASLWDIPVLLRYQGFGDSGWSSRMYVTGGVALRSVASIRTGNEAVFPNKSTSYTEDNPAVPANRNIPGAVMGIGLRFVTLFDLKVSPELRYIRWFGSTFDFESTQTRRGQLEIGVGITF